MNRQKTMARTSACAIALLGVLVFQTVAGSAAPRITMGPDLTLALVPVLTGVPSPIGVINAGDGSGRLFIVNQDGQIVIRDGARVLPEPFLDLTALIGRNGSETGLLGLAFHPDYRANGLFYVDFTALDGANTVMRFRVSPADPDRADPASGSLLLALPDRRP